MIDDYPWWDYTYRFEGINDDEYLYFTTAYLQLVLESCCSQIAFNRIQDIIGYRQRAQDAFESASNKTITHGRGQNRLANISKEHFIADYLLIDNCWNEIRTLYEDGSLVLPNDYKNEIDAYAEKSPI